MKIAVLGAGAMGCLFGGSLAEQGNDVTLIDVSAAQVEAINARGIRLTTDAGTRTVRAPACFPGDIPRDARFDVLILFTKTIHSRDALKSVMPLLVPGLTVLTLQNGLGNQELVEEFVAPDQIIVGMTGFPADLVEPGVVVSHGSAVTGIADATGTMTPRTEKLGHELSKAGFNCVVSTEVFKNIWEKVAFNAAANAVTCITRLSIGDLMQHGGRRLIYDIARESVAVANAKGVPAEYENVRKLLDHVCEVQYHHKSSMLQDFLAERWTEADSLNGAIVRIAESLGMDAPLNRMAYALVDVLQNTYDLRCRP